MKRKIVLAMLGLVVLMFIVGLLVMLNLGNLVEKAVETGGSIVLGVPTELDNASVSLLGGTVGLDGLSLGSPEGFEAPEMFKLGHAHTTADVWSLTSGEIVVREVVIDGPEITLEFAGGKTNWGTLLARLKSAPTGEEEKEKSEKTIRVDRIVFSNGKIRVAGVPMVGSATVPLPDVEVTDLRSADGTGTTVRNVLADVISSLYKGMLGAVKGVVPVEELERLGKELQEALGEPGVILEKTGAAVDEAAKEAAEKAKDVLRGVLGGDAESDE